MAKHHQTVLGNRRYFSVHLNQFELKMEGVCFSETLKHLTSARTSKSIQHRLKQLQSEEGGSVPLRDVGTLNHYLVQKLTNKAVIYLTTAMKNENFEYLFIIYLFDYLWFV